MPLTILTWYPFGYDTVLRRRTSPADTVDGVVGEKYIARYPAVPPAAIVENATFVAPVTGAPFES